jgi:hypothetical protein
MPTEILYEAYVKFAGKSTQYLMQSAFSGLKSASASDNKPGR